MKRMRSATCFLIGVSLAMSSASRNGLAQGTAGVQPLARANTEFGIRLLRQLTQEKPRENVFISPYSISSLLQMLNTGARGETQAELNQVLGTSSFNESSLNAAYQELNRSILSQTNATLKIANALWYRAGAELKPEFAESNQKYFGATLQALDFSLPESLKIMNQWAARETQDRIRTIISPPIPGNTAIVLANAIYFKGLWEAPFDAKQTGPRLFHLAGGNEVTVPMMQQTRSFLYQETNGFQAVQLPYSGGELAMQIVLPRTNSNLEGLLETFNGAFWSKTLVAGFKERRGIVIVPRFTLESGIDLKPALAAMGLKSALSPSADLSGMSSSHLFLSAVKHQSFVEVNEQGTEAAAVTTGIIALAVFQHEPPPFEMILDRPFAFCISHRRTGSMLFLGVVNNPAAGRE